MRRDELTNVKIRTKDDSHKRHRYTSAYSSNGTEEIGHEVPFFGVSENALHSITISFEFDYSMLG
jgi:hypothetical protein